MSILSNNNTKICRKLAVRQLKTHKMQSTFLCISIVFVALLYTVVFFAGDSIQNSYLLQYQQEYGSKSHIVFEGLTEHQAEKLESHEQIKSSVKLRSLGVLSDELLEYRTIHLAVADDAYADTVDSAPTAGRMPESEDEIALDTLTLDSLGLPHELNQTVPLEWTPFRGEESQSKEFVLCGYWSNESDNTESCAWISRSCAEKMLPGYDGANAKNVTLGVILYQPKELESQAETILSDMGVGDVTYTTNLSFNAARIQYANSQAASYYKCTIFVVICGFLLIYNIMLVSVRERAELLAKMKALGMTPKQTRLFSAFYILLLCMLAVPLGVLIGFGLFYRMAPSVLFALTGIKLNLNVLSVQPLLASVILSVVTAWLASYTATRFVFRKMPAEISQCLNRQNVKSKKGNGKKITVWNMALRSLRMGKGTLVVTAVSLLAASFLLDNSYIRFISYDEDVYAEELYMSDYAFLDASCAGDYQRYNEKAGNITDDIAQKIKKHPAVTEYGEFLTHEVELRADEELHQTVMDFYNGISEADGKSTRRSTMEGHPDWIAGLERFEETGEYTSVLIGADGLAMKYVLFYECLDGSFDAEKFETGDYVLAVGASSSEGLSAASAGEKVIIGGEAFTVMATIEDWGIIPAGRDSRKAEFSLKYVMPSETLRELYPDTSIREMIVNINPDMEQEFENFFSFLDGNEGVAVQRRAEQCEVFRQEVFGEMSVELFVGILLFVISLINFVNMILTKVLARHREFALYQGLGMQKQQLRKMLFYEGIVHGGICLVTTMPVVAGTLWRIMPLYYSGDLAFFSNTSWAVTYQYSIMPIVVLTVIVIIAAILTPQLCLAGIEKKSIVQRLRRID